MSCTNRYVYSIVFEGDSHCNSVEHAHFIVIQRKKRGYEYYHILLR